MKVFIWVIAVLSLLCGVMHLASAEWTAGAWACIASVWISLYAMEQS